MPFILAMSSASQARLPVNSLLRMIFMGESQGVRAARILVIETEGSV
jgi:hypothetical protein